MKIAIIIITACLILGGCRGSMEKDKNETHVFAEKLTQGNLGEFFFYPMHDNTIEKIWQDENNHDLLNKVIEDHSTSTKSKFLACEVLFKKDIHFLQRYEPQMIAEIYAEALKNDYIGFANSWGLLYEHDDAGPVGIAFLTIGKQAIPALTELLDNENCPLYIGSEEATIGAMSRFRIKDFAAWYIGKIMENQLTYYPDFDSRDRQIEHLKEQLKENG